ncbi:MAG: hypothetical protein UHG68_07210 [Clostridia bacterium]|nr:hypothetical protein [Clostridia bacterium]
MRYKRYTGNLTDFCQAIKNFKRIPGIERAYINRSATEFITLDRIIIISSENPKSAINKVYGMAAFPIIENNTKTPLLYEWTVHYINPHSGKNDSMKMVRIHGKQYGLSYIMAKTFVDNPHSLKRVIHKDGNHNNYHAENLEWR